jgi:polyisoprenoid-binding protein YceI
MKQDRLFRRRAARLRRAGWWVGSGPVAVALSLAVLLSAGTRAAAPVQAWHIDEAHTSIDFKIDAVGFPTTRGHFSRYTGRILIDFAHPARSFTNFTVDSASVDVGSQTFNDFVRSAALLDVAEFPTLSFQSTQVDKLDPRTARVSGDLTMRGVSRPIALKVDVETDPAVPGRAVAFLATGIIARSNFGMNFGVPLIDDTLEMTVRTRALSDE